MEFVHGSDLKTAIQARGAIGQRKVAEIGAQVCKALSVAHGQDIIHRDVKPQNIMIQPDGNVKVMDFGIARAKNSVKSQTSAVLGTAHYISPEQAQGKDLTPASDIYSLGIVLYEAVTGQLPFDGPDSVSVAMKQVSEYPVAPRQVNPEIDPGLEAIIMRALEKDPLSRFATVNDMKHALDDFLAGRPVNVDPDGTQLMGAAFPSGAPNATSVMEPMEGADAQGRTMVADEQRQEEGMSGKKKALIVIGIVAALALIAGLIFALVPKSGTVPDVSGKTVAEATVLLQADGYTLGTTTEIYSDTVESGIVISTDPTAGSTLAQGGTVNLTVSKGKGQVSVPNVTGKSAAEAAAAIAKEGLTAVEGTAEYSSTVEEGKVIRTDPAAGSKVDAGSNVAYILSKGSETVEVPDVSGMTQKEAEAKLTSAGLTLGDVAEQESSKVSEGDVISQNPSSGTKVAKGTSVKIVVSSGLAEPPDVEGKSEGDATDALKNAGYSVKTSYSSSESVKEGYVISQSRSGTTVTITVSTGPKSSSSSSSSSTSSSSKVSSSSTASSSTTSKAG